MLEELRQELNEAISRVENLTDPEIVKKSQELDMLILQDMKGGR